MKRLYRLFLALLLILGIFSASYAPAYANSTPALGADVRSYDCGGTMPKNQAYGIVGVNEEGQGAGKPPAFTPNQCIRSEIRWAQTSTGSVKGQPKVQFSIAPADPGNTSSRWPTSGNTADYGKCVSVNGKGKDSLACGYLYGEKLAAYDVKLVNQYTPNNYPYWIEVFNTYFKPVNSIPATLNDAVMDGMVTYIQSSGSAVGIFSTKSQWDVYAGSFTKSQFKNLYGLNNWNYFTNTLKQAQKVCSEPSKYVVDHGALDLVQIVPNANDQDLSC